MLPLLSDPLLRGPVHIRSTDLLAVPRVDHGIFHYPVDLELHARHSMWIDTIAETELMASLLKKRGERSHPPEPVADLENAKELCNELVLRG